MKKLVTPIITTALLIASSNIYATQGFSGSNVDSIVDSMDKNNNDKISFEEYFQKSFIDNNDSFDVNKDGYITAGEVVLEIKEDLIQTIEEMRKQGLSEADINKTIENELNTAKAEAEAIIKAMDTDGDNLVEPGEIERFQQAQFDKLDKNNDGSISSADTKAKSVVQPKEKSYSVIPYDPS